MWFSSAPDPEQQIRDSRNNPKAAPFYERVAALGTHPNFLLAGIAARQNDGSESIVYVHDKIMLVDDQWSTIGSCNIATQSFFCDAEMNVALWDEDVVRALRVNLLQEHLGIDTARMEAHDALRFYREAARANTQARNRGEAMNGLTFALDIASYGR